MLAQHIGLRLLLSQVSDNRGPLSVKTRKTKTIATFSREFKKSEDRGYEKSEDRGL